MGSLIDNLPPHPSSDNYSDTGGDAAESKTKKEGVACQTVMALHGRPNDIILKQAKEREVDLIIMGSRGKSGLERLLVGSVTERVIGHAPCPVLVVPAGK